MPDEDNLRTALLAAVISYLACVPTSAQTPAAATMRCAQCSVSGQKPDASAADLAQITIVEQLKPAFHEGVTFQIEMIGRVLAVSPFLVEVLDVRTQFVDRNMKPKPGGPDEDDTCQIMRIETIDRASQSIVASLRLNDLITGRWVLLRSGLRYFSRRNRSLPGFGV